MKKIVSCSNHQDVKRVGLILETAARLQAHSKNFFWTHIGTGTNSIGRCDKMIKERGVSGDRFVFIKYIDRPWLMDFYQREKFHIFVNLSITEGGVPVSMMEAASMGLPFFCTNVGGNVEIVEHGVNGFLIDCDASAAEAAFSLWECLNDPTRLGLMGKASRRIWSLKFNAKSNYPAFAKDLIELFQKSNNRPEPQL